MPKEDIHRVPVDAKYQASSPFFYTVVTFKNSREISLLIKALKSLQSDEIDHIHLVDKELEGPGQHHLAEIILRLHGSLGKTEREMVINDTETAASVLKKAMQWAKRKHDSDLRSRRKPASRPRGKSPAQDC
jgi:hypothetical protein